MPLAFDFAARSDVGLVRSDNQDSGYAGPHLLVVADGMGGHAGGDIASSTAIGYLVELDDESHGSGEAGDELDQAIATANIEIGRIVAERSELKGMGTTVTALLRARNKLAIAHIGDSRAYVLRDGTLGQMTTDHSFVQTLIDQGRLTPEEAGSHPQRSLVTRVLTGAPGDRPDLGAREAHLGDRYLLCSDGLSGFVGADTIAEILGERRPPAETADRLVELALRAGAPDNVTVIVADVVDYTSGRPPSVTPQIVGAARLSPAGSKALRETPAAKAAALRPTLGLEEETEHLERLALAEEGATTRPRRLVRVIGGLIAAVIVLAGGSYAAYGWSQRQFYLGPKDGEVILYQGLDYHVGPLSLSTPLQQTGVSLDDLSDDYRATVVEQTRYGSRAEVDQAIGNLRRIAAACAASKARGQTCGLDAETPTASSSTTGTSTSTSPTATSTSSASTGPPAATTSRTTATDRTTTTAPSARSTS